MLLKTPKFWYPDNIKSNSTLIPLALSPISKLYQIAHKEKLKRTTTLKVDIPVICIGNITMGGSGKTPTCVAIKTLLTQSGVFKNPYFLTRGYGGNDHGPRRIEVHESSSSVGDEAILLASHSNTIISVDRHKGAKLAQSLGADCIIMDDGLQNLSLNKSFSMLVIDGNMGLGNNHTFPSGPLREPLEFAMDRIDAVTIIGKDRQHVADNIIKKSVPIFHARITPDYDAINKIDISDSFIAFAGIGYPEKFYLTLKKHNFTLLHTLDFADHHQYSKSDIEKIIHIAHNKNAKIITTEKDFVRIPQEYKNNIFVFPISIKWDNYEELCSLIKSRI